MPAKRFSNQTPEQIIKHLAHFLKYKTNYNLYVDPLGVSFRIEEHVEKGSGSRKERPRDWHALSKGKKRRTATKKHRATPKIRSRKMGRTVNLKGWGEAKKK
jgi:hypothetical protein